MIREKDLHDRKRLLGFGSCGDVQRRSANFIPLVHVRPKCQKPFHGIHIGVEHRHVQGRSPAGFDSVDIAVRLLGPLVSVVVCCGFAAISLAGDGTGPRRHNGPISMPARQTR